MFELVYIDKVYKVNVEDGCLKIWWGNSEIYNKEIVFSKVNNLVEYVIGEIEKQISWVYRGGNTK